MNTKNNIEDLLKKFRQGILTASEAKELSSLVKEGDNNELLKDTLSEYWRRSDSIDVEVPSDRIFKKIQQELPVPQRRKFVLFTVPFIRYAAVFLIAIGLTWFTKDFFSESTIKNELSNNDGINEITVSYGSKSKVTLPDGSMVSLNSGSTLRYPAKFSRLSRNVYVEGEAFFDVKKDKDHPFYVKTREFTVKVLGTKFNVKSYSDEKIIQTTLVCGSIEIYANTREISEKNRLLALKPNQQATFEVKSGSVEVLKKNTLKAEKSEHLIKPIAFQKQIDVNPIIAWKDNRLEFRDETFSELTRKLERWYDVEIIIKDPELKSVLFSGVFVKETVEQALNALKFATPFRYSMKKNQITITK